MAHKFLMTPEPKHTHIMDDDTAATQNDSPKWFNIQGI